MSALAKNNIEQWLWESALIFGGQFASFYNVFLSKWTKGFYFSCMYSCFKPRHMINQGFIGIFKGIVLLCLFVLQILWFFVCLISIYSSIESIRIFLWDLYCCFLLFVLLSLRHVPISILNFLCLHWKLFS